MQLCKTNNFKNYRWAEQIDRLTAAHYAFSIGKNIIKHSSLHKSHKYSRKHSKVLKHDATMLNPVWHFSRNLSFPGRIGRKIRLEKKIVLHNAVNKIQSDSGWNVAICTVHFQLDPMSFYRSCWNFRVQFMRRNSIFDYLTAHGVYSAHIPTEGNGSCLQLNVQLCGDV